MFTQFAVATPEQAKGLRGIKDGNGLHSFAWPSTEQVTFRHGWWERVGDFGSPAPSLTPAGHVALELREILGPDRNLTKAQAGALWKFGWTPATFRKLVALGLVIGGGALTEDGEKIVHVLRKYGVNVG